MNLTNKARALRKNQTDVERLLWKHLRNRQLYGYKFRRQLPIEPFMASFIPRFTLFANIRRVGRVSDSVTRQIVLSVSGYG